MGQKDLSREAFLNKKSVRTIFLTDYLALSSQIPSRHILFDWDEDYKTSKKAHFFKRIL